MLNRISFLIIVQIKLRREALYFDIAFGFRPSFFQLGSIVAYRRNVNSPSFRRRRNEQHASPSGARKNIWAMATSKEKRRALIRTVIQPSRCVNLRSCRGEKKGRKWRRRGRKRRIKELKVVQSARNTPSKQEKFAVHSLEYIAMNF